MSKAIDKQRNRPWSLYQMAIQKCVPRKVQSLLFDLFKAFDQIKRIDLDLFLHTYATCSELPSDISTRKQTNGRTTYSGRKHLRCKKKCYPRGDFKF